MSQVPITIRLMTEADRNFIGACWVRNSADLDYHRWISKGCFYRDMGQRVDHWIDTCTIFMATSQDDHDELVGFICRANGNTLHYIYVKHSMRGLGVGWALVNHAFPTAPNPLHVTHWATICERLCQKYPMLRFSPSKLGDPRRKVQTTLAPTPPVTSQPWAEGPGGPAVAYTPPTKKSF